MSTRNSRFQTVGKIIVVITVLELIFTVFIQLAEGGRVIELFHSVGSSMTVFVLALFVNWLLSTHDVRASYLPILLFVPNILQSFIPFIDNFKVSPYYFFPIVNFSYFAINIFVITMTYLKIRKTISSPLNYESEKTLDPLPYRDESLLGKLIVSIEERLELTSRRVFFSLIAMIVIVLVGSGASFGTVALNEVSKIRELESEREKLISMTQDLEAMNYNKSEDLRKDISELKMAVLDRYGRKEDYKEIIENIEKESYISWPDIAMRITIAALTLFLVQIFFHIYKYNQRQESRLVSKVELFKLYTDEDAELKELRKGLVSNVNSDTEFDKGPGNPTEQIINIIGKAQK